MSEPPLRGVVVGLGRIGATFQRDPLRHGPVTHAGAMQALPGVELVAGVDPDPARRAQFEHDFGVESFETIDGAASGGRPDLVSVSVPEEVHAEVVLRALDAGARRVICEKPMTADLRAASNLVGRLGDRASLVGVNFTRRYDPLHRELFGGLREERVTGVTGRYTAGVRNTGSHWLDGLHQTGARVEQVLAIGRHGGDDPTPTLVLRLAGGATGYLEAHDVADHLLFETDVTTATQRVQLLDSGTSGRRFRRRPSERFSGYLELLEDGADLPPGLHEPMLRVVEDGLTSIGEGRAMLCSVHDALLVHAVIDGVHRSLASGSWAAVQAVPSQVKT